MGKKKKKLKGLNIILKKKKDLRKFHKPQVSLV